MKRILLFVFLLMALAVLLGPLPGDANAATTPHFVYTNDDLPATNTVTGFLVKSDGGLTKIKSWETGGNGSSGYYATNTIKAVTRGDLLFASNTGSDTISVFTGASKGNLVLKGQVPVETGGKGISLAGGGSCLVAGFAGTGNVVSYKIGQGTLTKVTSNPVGGAVDTIAATKKGAKYYVAASLVDLFQIAAMEIDPTTCGMAAPTIWNTAHISAPAGLSFSPDGSILYMGGANFWTTMLEAFSFPDGAPEPGSPYTYESAGINSNVVLASPDGKCLFVSNQLSYSVTSIPLVDGIPGPDFAVYLVGQYGYQPAGMVMDKSGKAFFLAIGTPNQVSTQVITPGCGLYTAPGTPVDTGQAGTLKSLTAYP